MPHGERRHLSKSKNYRISYTCITMNYWDLFVWDWKFYFCEILPHILAMICGDRAYSNTTVLLTFQWVGVVKIPGNDFLPLSEIYCCIKPRKAYSIHMCKSSVGVVLLVTLMTRWPQRSKCIETNWRELAQSIGSKYVTLASSVVVVRNYRCWSRNCWLLLARISSQFWAARQLAWWVTRLCLTRTPPVDQLQAVCLDKNTYGKAISLSWIYHK